MEKEYFYMCKTDWESEVRYIGAKLYPDYETMVKDRECINGCGYVKLKIIEIESHEGYIEKHFLETYKNMEEDMIKADEEFIERLKENG